jgi:hypothetical protein
MNDTTRGIDGLVLRWIERARFVTGGVLALWCTVVAGRAYYYSQLAVPPPTRIVQLPGESPGAAARAVTAPRPGAWIARLEAASVALAATVLEGSDDPFEFIGHAPRRFIVRADLVSDEARLGS